ncbi:hypothetical protein B9Z32_08310 [Limnohabitans sp. MMS-10A-178]|nr:hypothetical protein B9Z32_08310 [Limnohabitans sp. MMS-10A-178]
MGTNLQTFQSFYTRTKLHVKLGLDQLQKKMISHKRHPNIAFCANRMHAAVFFGEGFWNFLDVQPVKIRIKKNYL